MGKLRKVVWLLALYVVCSADKGRTRTLFRNAHDVFYSDNCLVFQAEKLEGRVGVCDPKVECVVREGTVPAAGEPSDDYIRQESTGTTEGK